MKKECKAVRKALGAGALTSGQPAHLFTCPECRARVRISHAWRGIPRRETLEAAIPVDEVFLERIVRSLRQDRRQRAVRRIQIAAAAALLFFFFAGAGHRVAASLAAGAEDAYAQLVEPAGIDTLLPN
jgi:hypothetical protein